MIAALFVETNGVYFNDSRFEPWDEKRDARAYQGPHPVIAHPPCQLWGKFAKINFARWGGEHNRPGNDGGCFKAAIDAVRRFCGVLEHPAFSYAWSEFGLVRPKGHGWSRVGANEYVCEVWQSAYGHPARKRTWLFYVGKRPHELRWDRPEGTHQIGFHDQRGKERNKPTVRGKAASATPEAFAHELYLLAKIAMTLMANYSANRAKGNKRVGSWSVRLVYRENRRSAKCLPLVRMVDSFYRVPWILFCFRPLLFVAG